MTESNTAAVLEDPASAPHRELVAIVRNLLHATDSDRKPDDTPAAHMPQIGRPA
jgi:hypothetical protein